MAALAHSLRGLQLLASPLRSDLALLVHSLSGEEQEVEGGCRLEVAPSGWALLRSAAGEPRWVNDVLRVAAATAPDGRVYLSGGGATRWLQDVQGLYNHRYVRLQAAAGANADTCVVKVYRLEAPRAGNFLFWQLRDCQDHEG